MLDTSLSCQKSLLPATTDLHRWKRMKYRYNLLS